MGTEGPPSLPAAPLTLRELESCALLFSLGQVRWRAGGASRTHSSPHVPGGSYAGWVGQVDRLWGQSHRAHLRAVAAAAAGQKPPGAHTQNEYPGLAWPPLGWGLRVFWSFGGTSLTLRPCLCACPRRHPSCSSDGSAPLMALLAECVVL